MTINKIKLKRGPAAKLPKLDVGELALTTDTKQLFAGFADGNKELTPNSSLSGELKSHESLAASETVAGHVKLSNTLYSSSTTAAVTALQAKLLDEKIYATYSTPSTEGGDPDKVTSPYFLTKTGNVPVVDRFFYVHNCFLSYYQSPSESSRGQIAQDYLTGELYTRIYYSYITSWTPWKKYVTDDTIKTGTSSPEGIVTASVGTLYLRKDGASATTLYVKTSGVGNTGWTAK